ncbi:hypothetical protein [Avibacterium avium]|uniref:hypothetical protein n=1 Tax=Avibacterium avium TaxID=751 RepID=UPI003BF7DDCC
MTLFSAAAQYMKEGIDNSDYMDYIHFREKYEEYKNNWINIRLRGVITLALLHYAKNKLNLDLNEL